MGDRPQPVTEPPALGIIAKVTNSLADLEQDVLSDISGIGFLEPPPLAVAKNERTVSLYEVVPRFFVVLIGNTVQESDSSRGPRATLGLLTLRHADSELGVMRFRNELIILTHREIVGHNAFLRPFSPLQEAFSQSGAILSESVVFLMLA